MIRGSSQEKNESHNDMEGVLKSISQLTTKISQLEEQLSIQGSHQKKIIQQNDEYVQQYMQIQETIEKLKNIFRNEQGEEITINLQTYLQQKVVGVVLQELKFNQVISQLDNKYRDSIHNLNVRTEQFKEKQDSVFSQIEGIKLENKQNTALIHQNYLFKDQMERIKQSQEKTEKLIQESIDKFWKYDQDIQNLSSQISEKVEQKQILDIQSQLKDNFVGIYHYQSEFEMLLGKVNAKTDQTYFEEKFNYIDKAVLQTSQKFEEQIERDLKIYFSKIRQEYKKEFLLQEQEFQKKVNEIYHQLSENQNNIFNSQRQVEVVKSEQILLNQAIKQSANDCLQKIQLFDQVIQKQSSDIIKKVDQKPSHIELKVIEQRMDQKLVEFQNRVQDNHQKVLAYFKNMEEKSQKEEEGLQKLQSQLSGVVTYEALQEKWTNIEKLKDESIRIKQDQDTFRKSFKNIEDRLAVKISKFEIDQLRNAIESEYVKIPFFDQTIHDCQTLIRNSEANMNKELKNRDAMIDKVKVEQIQIIEKAKQNMKEFKDEIEEDQKKIQNEQAIQKIHLETCKTLAQKVDESLIYKASKIDLNEFVTFCKFTFLDRDQLSKFIGQREEFAQMRSIEKQLNSFYIEYKSWIDTFNKKMCFSFDKMIELPIQFQWVEEIKDKINEINEIKSILTQKAEHSDLIRLFSQKANKATKMFKKQLIYEVVSLQSFIKCMQSRSDFLPSQQLSIQMNLRQLTKLLQWISFSPLDGEFKPYNESQLKLSVATSLFQQMEKVSDSITSKFMLFQKKMDEMGDSKFVNSENKILDEYLSMIMQDQAHEEVYGNKQKSENANLLGVTESEVTTQKVAVQNSTITRPFKIRKTQKSNSISSNTTDNFFMNRDKLLSSGKHEHHQHEMNKVNTLQTQNTSLQHQYTRETSSFYDPLSQLSHSQKNSPQQQLGGVNHFFENDSMESLKQNSCYVKQDNKTITVGGSVYEINDVEEFNKNLNELNSNQNKSLQLNQFINLAVNTTTAATIVNSKTDSSRFQQFYKHPQKKTKTLQSVLKNHHSASQSPSSTTNSSLSRNSFMSPNVIKKFMKSGDALDITN